MMFPSFEAMREHARKHVGVARIGVASPEDPVILQAVMNAVDMGIIHPVLVGDASRIRELIASRDRNPADFEIVNLPDSRETGVYVAQRVASGEFQAPMKGHMHTAHFLRPHLNKELGLIPPKGFLNQVTIYEEPYRDRLRIICDCAVNIAPTLDQTIQIIKNAVALARAMGCEQPKVAVIAPVEVVNPDIPSTMNTALLAKMGDRGHFGADVLVDGPLALDLAVSPEAARLKGVGGPVAGEADILIAPDLDAGNMTHKALVHVARLKTAGFVIGAKVPIIMTSRTDSAEDKTRSILASIATAPRRDAAQAGA